MRTSRKKKDKLLGQPFGTANGKLRKAILFQLARETGKDICFHCGEKIIHIDDFSIEHKIPWLNGENPKELFFDLDNIAFSHLSCNVSASRRQGVEKTGSKGEYHHQSILTWKKVDEIREKLSQGCTLISLSKEYKTCERNIARIRDNETWVR